MGGKINMDEETGRQADEEAILDLFTYLDQQDSSYNGKPLSEVMVDIEEKFNNSPGDIEMINIIQTAITNNPDLGKMEIVSQSSIDGNIDMTILNAVTFRDPSTGDMIVSYRGTGDGKWVDNGIGLATEQSQMQGAAIEYFDHVVEKFDLADGGKTGILDVSGHSKGGNEAQIVTIESEYGYLIDHCYNFDGQGVSNQALEKYENMPDFECLRDKIILISGENDYVHDLGNVIAKEENTYFLETPNAKGVGDYHDLRFLFGNDGKLNGEASNGQGPIGVLAKELSERLMAMDNEDIQDSAITLMTILEMVMKYDDKIGGEYLLGTGDVEGYTPEECIGFFANGIPLIVETLIGTEEGRAALKMILDNTIPDLLSSMRNKWGTAGTFGIIFLTAIVAIMLVPVLGTAVVISKMIEFVFDLVDKIKELSEKLRAMCQDLKQAVINIIHNVDSWMNEHLNPGMIYANANPCIVVNTDKLRSYADRINQLNRRIMRLDLDMNQLYKHAGLLDLWNLMQADFLTAGSIRLKLVENYMNDTASDFEQVEQEIATA